MVVLFSKFLALLALTAYVAAAPPASSGMSTVMETSATDISPTTEVQSAAPTTTKAAPLVMTRVTAITLITTSVSGSDSIITSTIREKTTLSPETATATAIVNPASSGVVTPSVLPAFTVPVSSPATTATSPTATTNGARANAADGMGLAAIIGVAGLVVAAL